MLPEAANESNLSKTQLLNLIKKQQKIINEQDRQIKELSRQISNSPPAAGTDGGKRPVSAKKKIKEGYGYLVLSNGCYKGPHIEKTPHGKGILTLRDRTVYKGQFENGKAHGKGIMTLPNGTVYKGPFENGKAHGKGIATFPNGKVYKGQFENGEFVGSTSP